MLPDALEDHEAGDCDEDCAINPAYGLVKIGHMVLVILEILPLRLPNVRVPEARILTGSRPLPKNHITCKIFHRFIII